MHWRINKDRWRNLGNDRTDPVLRFGTHHPFRNLVLFRKLHQCLKSETGLPPVLCRQRGIAHDSVVLDELKVIEPSLRDFVVERAHLIPWPVSDADHHDRERKEGGIVDRLHRWLSPGGRYLAIRKDQEQVESHAHMIDMSHRLSDQRLEGCRTRELHQGSDLSILLEEGIQSPGGVVVRIEGEDRVLPRVDVPESVAWDEVVVVE